MRKRIPLLSVLGIWVWLAGLGIFALAIHSSQMLLVSSFVTLTGMGLVLWRGINTATQTAEELLTINQHLQVSENRFRLAFDGAGAGMALISPEGKCFKVNAALCELLGYKEQELLKLNIETIVDLESDQKEWSFSNDVLTAKNNTYQSELRLHNKSGHLIWVSMYVSIVRDEISKPLYFIMQLRNISSEKTAKEQLQKMAYHDPLTGLANRNKFNETIKQIAASAKRHQVNFAIIMLDLDHFKNINDTVGHDAGDCLLQIVAERLKGSVRSTDLVARFGGDEFALVITDIKKLEEVVLVSQKILLTLLQPIIIKNHELYITTSIGISVYPYDGEELPTLLKNADLALYRAKETGRNHYEFCTPEMTARAHEKMAKHQALSQALAREEFTIYYQPKMDLVHQRISGVEGLLRWKNEKFGVVSPAEVISLTEETGLIVPLGNWILKTACKQIKHWQEAGFSPLTLSINLSPRQFRQPEFIVSMMKILRDNHFSPEYLEFEITEKLILQDPENTLLVLQALKEAGAQVSIDDFGTGYSSLSYLKSFNVDKIKIDKTFIQRIENDETSCAIISAIIVMANKLKIKTIAEGVETLAQYDFLLGEKCSEIQGYLLSKPLDATEMQKFLQDTARRYPLLETKNG